MKISSKTYSEIYHQPDSFQSVNKSLCDIFRELDRAFAEPYDELIFTGCGTSFYLAQTAAFIFSSCSSIPAKAVCCSELYYFTNVYIKNRKVLVLPVTRKSYTTEVRKAVDKVRSILGIKTLAITCDKESKTYNDFMILSPDSDEDSVIMTGSFTSMVYLTVIMSLYLSNQKELISKMCNYKEKSLKFLMEADRISEEIIRKEAGLNLFITLGQGINYGVANECMNKMKEMGLVNSEAYHTMEFRHGPMSLVDENTMITILVNQQSRESDYQLAKEMKSYGAKVLLAGINIENDMPGMDYYLSLCGEYNDMQNAAMLGFIGQCMGYHLSLKKGLDADMPRHLTQAIVLK